jgi:SNF2 family DNA or RNA helicase
MSSASTSEPRTAHSLPSIQAKFRKIPVPAPRKIVQLEEKKSESKSSSSREVIVDPRVPLKINNEKFGEPNEFGVRFLIQNKCSGKCEDGNCTCSNENKEAVESISLKSHQIKALKVMIEREAHPIWNVRGGANCASMGLGKTLMFLSLVMRDYSHPTNHPDYPAFPSLVVCPLGNISDPWLDQISMFFGSSCPVLVFRKEHMGKEFDTITIDQIRKYKVVITNYDTIKSVAKKYKLYEPLFERDNHDRRQYINSPIAPSAEMVGRGGDIMLFNTPWHRIALDESAEVISNPKTIAFYSIMCLYSLRKWILTGTPIRNKAKDLWSQFWFLGFRKLSSKQFTVSAYRKHQLDKCMIIMSGEDAGVNLPELEIKDVPIHLAEKELECYNYWTRAVKEIYKRWTLGCANFANVLTLFLRQRQCCVSAFTVTPESARGYRDGENEEDYSEAQKRLASMTSGLSEWIRDVKGTAGIQSAKNKKVISIIQNEIPKNEKILIFSNFKRENDVIELALQAYLPNEKYTMIDGDITGDDRNQAIESFKKSDVRIMLMTYKAGSVGLNLTVANNVIMMETVWTPSVLKQAAGRAHRVGQDKKVKVWQLIAEKTIERAMMMEIMVNKQKEADAFMKGEIHKGKSGQIDAKMLGKLLRY